jgi:hypothetical protein
MSGAQFVGDEAVQAPGNDGDEDDQKPPSGWRFCNRVEGERYDLTASQFLAPIPYAGISSTRAEALAGTKVERYAVLKARVGDFSTGHPLE